MMRLEHEMNVRGRRAVLSMAMLAGCICSLVGCSDGLKQSSPTEISEFDSIQVTEVAQVGTIQPAAINFGPYTVQRGDVLQVYMPEVMGALSLSNIRLEVPSERAGAVLCRVDETGTILLPHVDPMPVAGKTLAEIDKAVRAAYFPGMLKTPPTVVTSVDQFTTRKIVVTGSVGRPGVFDLKIDEMNLYTAIANAGGLTATAVGSVRIRRFNSESATADENKQELFVLPLQGANLPYVNLELQNGDVVEVTSDTVRQFSVIGLVNSPGAFPFPPGRSFTLMQGLASAGGMRLVSDPHYVTVYRQNAQGTLSYVRFKIDREGLAAMGHARIKPGDVLIVEQTLRTKINEMIPELIRSARDFGVGIGSAAAANSIINNN
ncbi:MAG: hypothetical protein GC159_16990 [Phycisphaera sp.]|nr:hypothetical protein [Phycisphaera sp.]